MTTPSAGRCACAYIFIGLTRNHSGLRLVLKILITKALNSVLVIKLARRRALRQTRA